MIYIFDKTFVTPEGFAIGDTVEKMKDMYGSNYQQLEDETVVITTEFKYNGISFFVHSNDGKDFSPVYMIKYGDWIE
jgi:hypothetical protein